MIPLTLQNLWSNVQGYDTTDPVLGGPTGPDNNPIIALGDRTEYLFDRLGRYETVKKFTGNYLATAADKNKLLLGDLTANAIVTVDDVNTFADGTRLPIKLKATGTKFAKIVTTSSQPIYDGTLLSTEQWLYNGEEVELIASVDVNPANSFWLLRPVRGNFDRIGQDAYARVLPRNAAIANGDEVNRADYPRINKLMTDNPSICVDEVTWMGDALNYRGFFCNSANPAKFRWPDMRGMFLRGIDLTRGVRLGGVGGGVVGSYEQDDIKSHDHPRNPFNQPEHDMRANAPGGGSTLGNYTWHPVSALKTGVSGGVENIVKNIGLLPVIYF